MAEEKVIIEVDIKTDKALADTVALKAQVEKLKEETKNLKETEGELSEAYTKKNAELKATQKELQATQNVLTNLTKVENEEGTTIQKLVARNAELRLERDRTNISTKEGQDRVKAINKEMDDNTKVIKDNADAQKAQTMNVVNYASAIEGLPGPLGGAVSGMMGMVKAAWAFIATPIGAIIAAVTLAVTALYEIFKTFAPVVDKVEQAIASVTAVFGVLKDVALSLFTGQKDLAESFEGLGDSMAKAAKDAAELKKQEQDLEDLQVQQIESSAKSKRQIDELMLQSKDRTKTEQERADLITKALELEEEAYNKRKEIGDGEYNQALQKIAISNRLTEEQIADVKARGVVALQELQDTKAISDDEIKTFAEASAARESILNDSIALREKAINRQNALLDAAEEKELKRIEASKANAAKVAEERKKAEEKAKADKEKADKEEIDRQKRLLDEQMKSLDLELRAYQAKNQEKLSSEEWLTQEAIDEEIARQTVINDIANKALKLQLDNKQITQEEYNVAILEQDVELNNQRTELQMQYEEQEKQRKIEAAMYQFDLDQELLSQTLFGEFEMRTNVLLMQEQQEKDFANKTLLTEESKQKALEKINKKYRAAEKQIALAKYQAELALASDFAKNIATIAGTNTKVGKMASAAATTISTIQGGVAAFTGMATAVPGPVGIALGIAASAAALASGYASVKKILSTSSGLPGDSSSSSVDTSTSSASTTTTTTVPATVNPSLGQGIISRQVGDNSAATIKTAFSEALKENPLQPTLVTNDVTLSQQSAAKQSKTATL